MAEKPEIKPSVNRAERGERRSPGMLAGLLAKIGLGGAAGAEGAGGVASGGMLASKAGVLSLALIGTTVAGGVGVVGYKMMGGGSSRMMSGEQGFNSMFEAKPEGAQKSEEELEAGLRGSAAGSGGSQSLQFLTDANKPAPAPVAPPPAPDASAGASAVPAAPRSSPRPYTAASSAPAPRPSSGKMGGLSGLGSARSGGGGTISPSGASGAVGETNFGNLRAQAGSASAMKAQGGASRVGAKGGSRQFANSTRALALQHLGNQNASSSMQSGVIMDGAKKGGGGSAGAVSLGGVGAGGRGKANVDPSVTPQSESGGAKEVDVPEVEKGTNVTPWQWAVDLIKILLAVAGLLFMVAGPMVKSATPWVQALGKIVAGLLVAVGLAITALSVYILTQGEQALQSIITMVMGAGFAASGIAMIASGDDKKKGLDEAGQKGADAKTEAHAKLAGGQAGAAAGAAGASGGGGAANAAGLASGAASAAQAASSGSTGSTSQALSSGENDTGLTAEEQEAKMKRVDAREAQKQADYDKLMADNKAAVQADQATAKMNEAGVMVTDTGHTVTPSGSPSSPDEWKGPDTSDMQMKGPDTSDVQMKGPDTSDMQMKDIPATSDPNATSTPDWSQYTDPGNATPPAGSDAATFTPGEGTAPETPPIPGSEESTGSFPPGQADSPDWKRFVDDEDESA